MHTIQLPKFLPWMQDKTGSQLHVFLLEVGKMVFISSFF
jgi:hypothetical protein